MKPFTADTFRMTDFMTELFHEEREAEHIDRLRPVRKKRDRHRAWRAIQSREVIRERAREDYREDNPSYRARMRVAW